MVWNEYIWVNLLSGNWVERALITEMLLNHFLFVGVPTLDNDRLIHQIIAYWTLQKVWHLKLSLILLSIQIFGEIVIHRTWILHRGSLGRELNRHKVLVRLHFLLQIDHHCCLFIRLNFSLFVKLYFLRLENLLLNLIFVLSHFLTRAQRVSLAHALYTFIDLRTAANVQLTLLDKCFTHQLKRFDILIIQLDGHRRVLQHQLKLFQLFEAACSIVKVAWVCLVNVDGLCESGDCLLVLSLLEKLIAQVFQAQTFLFDPGVVLPAELFL